jgi:hypothetical protein
MFWIRNFFLDPELNVLDPELEVLISHPELSVGFDS